jgi:hypothetical protein
MPLQNLDPQAPIARGNAVERRCVPRSAALGSHGLAPERFAYGYR